MTRPRHGRRVSRWRRLPIVFGVAGVPAAALTVALTVNLLTPAHAPAPQPSPPSPVTGSPVSPHESAVDAAYRHGLRVWLEADLVKQWKAGPDRMRAAVKQIASLAARPGVAGIKIADELGYRDGVDSPEKLTAFLTDSATALHAAVPGKPLLIDLIVPELGCLPDYQPPLRWATICAAQTRGKYPQLALDQVDGYFKAHLVDVVDLSTGLQPTGTYEGWGVTRDEAQRAAWAEVLRRGWDRHVQLQARKALAHPGQYTATDTEDTLTTFVDVPFGAGAKAVDVWTWRQQYQGDIYRLLDPGLRSNALWEGLAKRRARGVPLFTHLSPISLEAGLDADLEMIAKVFTDLFVAAGTG